MPSSKIYDTPTYNVTITGGDFTDCDIYITFRQGRSRELVFGPDDFDYIDIDVENQKAQVGCTFSQEQSSIFRADSKIEFQVTVVDSEDYRVTSDIYVTSFGRQLRQEVIDNA